MNTFCLSKEQIELMKELTVYHIEVNNIDITIYTDEQGTDAHVFNDDGSVVRRLGEGGVYNFYDIIASAVAL